MWRSGLAFEQAREALRIILVVVTPQVAAHNTGG